MEQAIPMVGWNGKLGERWPWLAALGVALLLLGIFAAAYSWVSTVVSVVTLGYILVLGGIAHIIAAFSVKGWSGFFVELLLGLFGIVMGLMVVASPIAASVGLTLLIALFLLVEGAFRTASALVYRYHSWGFGVFNGLLTFLLGILVYAEWPFSAFWVIGTFLAIRLLFSGAGILYLALLLKKLRSA